MKLLIVSQYFYPENFRINDLVDGLLSRGYEVDILTGIPNYPVGKFYQGYSLFKGPYRDHYNGANVYRIPILPRGRKKGVMLALNYISFVIFGFLLGPFVCRKRYDHVFVFEVSPITVALPAIFLRYLKKIKMTMWVTDLWPESLSATGAVKNSFVIGCIEALVRFIYRHTDTILVSSKAFIPSIRKYADKEPQYFPQWAENCFISPSFVANVDEELPKGFKIVFAGNIGTSQGFDTIIDAANILKPFVDIHWVIIGDGLGKKHASEKVKILDLDNNFHFIGTRAVDMMPAYNSSADALLVSLKSSPLFNLTVPGKLQSCLASGKPIIGSIDGEAASIIKDAGGIVTAAGDARGLADSVLKLYEMSGDERSVMGRKGKAYYLDNFERDFLIDKLSDIIINNARQ